MIKPMWRERNEMEREQQRFEREQRRLGDDSREYERTASRD